MVKKEKFYITTAIDYVNAAPHIGHAYQKIVADCLARWNKFQGKDVLFVTGTDEHGKKVQEAALAAGKSPKEFVDETSKKFIKAWKALDINYDRFIRTTDADHKKIVVEFIKKCNDAGDIYKGKYSGNYCTGCEAYVTEKDLLDGKCPVHPNREIDQISEESYFFKLSDYQSFLLDLYKTDFTLPKIRRNEVRKRVEEGLNDLSISRTSFDWGIPFPLDKNHITYVWFDALINYYTATREKGREDFWGKPTVHLLGKDNTWFHNVYWPSMLKSAGLDLPSKTLNHGFLTFNGQKISKSLGNSISPLILVEKYGVDAIRYFCLRHFSFASGSDGDFNENTLMERYNNELANKLGNLVSRVSSLAEKYGVEKKENTLLKKFDSKKIKKYFDEFKVDQALNEIFAFIDVLNEYVQSKKPWETKDTKVLYELCDSLRYISDYLEPFIPKTAQKIKETFSSTKIKKSPVLFQKIELDVDQQINKEEELKEDMAGIAKLEYKDWEKADLRVAQIKSAEEIEGADKLFKITLDAGELGERIVCAGIKKYYKSKDLTDKKVAYLSNLAPRKMRGIESQGMLLAAFTEDDSNVSLLTFDKDMENGSQIG